MIEFDDQIKRKIEIENSGQIMEQISFHYDSYDSFLNTQALFKSVKQNVWKYELRSILGNFLQDLKVLEQTIKFKLSGKILNSSAYVLKTKTSIIINNSLETKENIEKIQEINEIHDSITNYIKDLDDYEELFESIVEPEEYDLLNEEKKEELKQERLRRLLNLEPEKLNKKIEGLIVNLNVPPKLFYKRVEIKDLNNALTEILHGEHNNNKIINSRKKKIDKENLTFLPQKFINNTKNKNSDFKTKVKDFYEKLKNQYKGEPIQFLKLIHQATVKELIDALLCTLYLINQKKIEIWKQFNNLNKNFNENYSENSEQNLIFLSPLF